MGESVLMGACARTIVGVTLLPVTVLKARYEVLRTSMRHKFVQFIGTPLSTEQENFFPVYFDVLHSHQIARLPGVLFEYPEIIL